MKNDHSTDGIAEDLIRSFVQMGCAEIHAKTLLEKRVSEIENGIIDVDDPDTLKIHMSEIRSIEEDLNAYAQARREDMLYLFNLYGGKGDKEKWCTVKHLSISAMCAFEVWQASESDSQLEIMAMRKNKMFIKALSQFLGVEITECASCFADILKGG